MTVTSERQTGIAGELRHVDKWYGDQHVLRDVSVRVGAGEIVALIGRSGSGKSTVLRVLAGLSTDHTGDRVGLGRARAGLPGAPAVPVARRRAPMSATGLIRNRLPRAEVALRADQGT